MPGSQTIANGDPPVPKTIRPHRLKENKGTSWPRAMLFFDTETTAKVLSPIETEYRLRLGWACYWQCDDRDRHSEGITWTPFTTPAGFIDLVESYAHPKTSLYCVCHNLDFDGCVTASLVQLPARGWQMIALFTDGGAKIWRFRKAGATVIFLDSLNYFRESLATLGARVGLPKGQVNFATVGDEELSQYCRNDVDILYRVFVEYRRFLQEGNYGNFAVSAASQALKVFTHRFMPRLIMIHNREEAIRLERAGYYGGRCECFRVGVIPGGPFLKLDVNSLYPFVMATRPHPLRLCGYLRPQSLRELYSLMDRYLVCARVTVRCTEPCYPYRPSGRLLFPVGEYETVLIGDELILARLQGAIVAVSEASLYEAEVLFDRFVEHLYGERLAFAAQGDQMYAYLCKLMMNSLYGKFGQKASDWITVGPAPIDEVLYHTIYHQDGSHTIERCVAGLQQHKVDLGNSFNTFVAISASVTASGRAYLWRLMETAGRGNVLYVDTDSLFVNLEGARRLAGEMQAAHELGKLKLEATAESLELRQPKDYTFGATVTRKGISQGATPLWLNSYTQENFLSLKSLMHRGTVDRYIVSWQTKTLSTVYGKGVVGADGRITPFVLSPASLAPA